DNRGVQALEVKLDGQPLAVEAGSRVGWLPEGLHAGVPLSVLNKAFNVEIKVDLTGTSHLGWLPVGAETTVQASADWPHPGFDGRHLPLGSDITDEGFKARWAVSRLSSRVPQMLANCGPELTHCEGLDEGRFGVRLVDPVDRYLMTDRAMKYALLFLGLVFGAVFLVEALASRPVHLVQYGLTGLALAMFYLLLLSLSEHIGFGPAYALAAASCSGLLAYYLSGVLGGRRAGLGFGMGLATLYGLLYALLGSEDYALLVGAAVLFAALASVMALTRRVDWHRLGTWTSGTGFIFSKLETAACRGTCRRTGFIFIAPETAARRRSLTNDENEPGTACSGTQQVLVGVTISRSRRRLECPECLPRICRSLVTTTPSPRPSPRNSSGRKTTSS
nr:cell envelope integrity protein CreD [Pseudoxanthomonas sp.]